MTETVIIAIISSLSALIPSIATAILNNRFAIKIKKLEILETNKRNAIINFLSSLGKCCDGTNGISSKEQSDFMQSLNILLVYFPNSNIDITNIKELFNANDIDKIYKEIKPIIKELSSSLK